MPATLSGETQVRMFDGSIKLIKELKVKDEMMGEDGTARTLQSISSKQCALFRVSYNNYVDDRTFKQSFCGSGDTRIVLVPDGNRQNSLVLQTNAQKQYYIKYIDPVLNQDKQVENVELKTKTFQQPDEALQFVQNHIPNFLFEKEIDKFLEYPQEIRQYFFMIRPLLPVRYTAAITAIFNDTKELFDRAKEYNLRSSDLPWLSGLFLSCGGGNGKRFEISTRELYKDVNKELNRIFSSLKTELDSQFDEKQSLFIVTPTAPETCTVLLFLEQMHLYDPKTQQFTKEKLRQNIRLESFSRIRGPFLAGVMDGCSDYGLADQNYGLECYLRGIPQGQTRNEIADLAKSCSLAVIEEKDTLILAGGMIFRIPCVNSPPKDIPGLVSLTSYPGEHDESTLLGNPMGLSIEECKKQGECFDISCGGKFLLADYTVIGM